MTNVSDTPAERLVSDNIAGFYHDPLIFLHEFPMVRSGIPKAFLDRFDIEVFGASLDCGLKISATVEGHFKFDFNAMADCAYQATDGLDFDYIAEMQVRRTRVMNAYLAFFNTRLRQTEKYGLGRMVVTPELMIKSNGTGASPAVSRIAFSRFERLRSPSLDAWDAMRTGPIDVEIARSAAADLSELIEKHGDDGGVLLADLFLRATKAFQEHNHSLSVITYWTVIERIINDLWKKMLEDESIIGNRKRRLTDHRTYSASSMTEILVFNGYIPKEMCDDLAEVRTCRNDWIHKLAPITADKAVLANTMCERLLNLAMDVTLDGTSGLTLIGR